MVLVLGAWFNYALDMGEGMVEYNRALKRQDEMLKKTQSEDPKSSSQTKDGHQSNNARSSLTSSMD